MKVAVCELGRRQPARAGALDERAGLGRQLVEGLQVGVVQRRHQQGVVERDGDADVDTREADDVLAEDAGVEPRVLAQRQRHRANDEVVQRRHVAVLELRELRPHRHRAGHVDLGGELELRDLRARLDHPAPDRPLHRAELDPRLGASTVGRAASPASDGAACACAPSGMAAAARTSARTMRPPGPVPETEASGTPSSAAVRRATGVAATRAARSCDGDVGPLTGAGRHRGGWCRDRCARCGRASTAAARRATTAPSAAVPPSGTTISASVPVVSASSETVALSVSISAISSPRVTVSPTAFSHLTTVASSIESESLGIRTSTVVCSPPLNLRTPAGRRVSGREQQGHSPRAPGSAPRSPRRRASPAPRRFRTGW